eukprot:6144293-Lingulodinium_polyedra.AAC.1
MWPTAVKLQPSSTRRKRKVRVGVRRTIHASRRSRRDHGKVHPEVAGSGFRHADSETSVAAS